jgi:hypothetical protein
MQISPTAAASLSLARALRVRYYYRNSQRAVILHNIAMVYALNIYKGFLFKQHFFER